MTTRNKFSLMSGDRLLKSARPAFFGSVFGNSFDVEEGGDEGGGHGHCRRPLIQLPGTGDDKFKLDPPGKVVEECVNAIAQIAQAQRERAAKRTSGDGGDGQPKRDHLSLGASDIADVISGECCKFPELAGVVSQAKGGGTLSSLLPKTAVAGAPASKGVNHRNGPTLFIAIGGLDAILYRGRFDAHIAELFDPFTGVLEWARVNVVAEHQFVVDSLDDHCKSLIKLTEEVLPSVVHAVAAQYRDASEEQWINAAVALLKRQLAKPLYILDICLDSWRQRRDGKYDQLPLLEFTLSQCLQLYGANNTQVLHVGDAFLPHFCADGPSTIPGDPSGPVRAHVVQVPHDERDILMFMLLIYLHEFRHNYFSDVDGLPEQMAAAVVKAIKADAAAGKYKLSAETIKIGNQEVPLLDLLIQIYVQTMPENDADVSGGILLGGPAFSNRSMIPFFGALNCRGQGVFNTNRFLRSRNYFLVDEKTGELVFAPHTPDFPRALVIGASALDIIGFPDDANECRELATQAAGVPLPEVISWVCGDPKSPFKKVRIDVKLSDLLQLGPTVVNAMINEPLPCLGGISTGQQVNWTPKSQEKARKLADILIAGGNEVPADMGDVFATHIASAVAMAYWDLCAGGTSAVLAMRQVESGARKMMTQIRDAAEAAKAAAKAPTAVAPATDATGGGGGSK